LFDKITNKENKITNKKNEIKKEIKPYKESNLFKKRQERLNARQ
jgi:hypothetical protein